MKFASKSRKFAGIGFVYLGQGKDTPTDLAAFPDSFLPPPPAPPPPQRPNSGS